MSAEPLHKIEVNCIAPFFQLSSTEGETISIWDQKGQKNVIILFTSPQSFPKCIDFFNDAANMFGRLDRENTVVLAVVSGDFDSAQAISEATGGYIPILLDPEGSVTETYTDHLPSVFVIDRFGELSAEWITGARATLPTQAQILDVIESVNSVYPK